MISEGYDCNNSTDKDVDDDDDDDDNESVNEIKLQPNLSAFEISTENEKILFGCPCVNVYEPCYSWDIGRWNKSL